MDGWNTIVSFWDGLFSGAFWLVLGSVTFSFVPFNQITTTNLEIIHHLLPFKDSGQMELNISPTDRFP